MDKATKDWLKTQQEIHGVDQIPNELIDDTDKGVGSSNPIAEALAVPPCLALPGGVVVRINHPTVGMIKRMLLSGAPVSKAEIVERLLLECLEVEVRGQRIGAQDLQAWVDALPVEIALEVVDKFTDVIDLSKLMERAQKVAGKLARMGA